MKCLVLVCFDRSIHPSISSEKGWKNESNRIESNLIESNRILSSSIYERMKDSVTAVAVAITITVGGVAGVATEPNRKTESSRSIVGGSDPNKRTESFDRPFDRRRTLWVRVRVLYAIRVYSARRGR